MPKNDEEFPEELKNMGSPMYIDENGNGILYDGRASIKKTMESKKRRFNKNNDSVIGESKVKE